MMFYESRRHFLSLCAVITPCLYDVMAVMAVMMSFSVYFFGVIVIVIVIIVVVVVVVLLASIRFIRRRRYAVRDWV